MWSLQRGKSGKFIKGWKAQRIKNMTKATEEEDISLGHALEFLEDLESDESAVEAPEMTTSDENQVKNQETSSPVKDLESDRSGVAPEMTASDDNQAHEQRKTRNKEISFVKIDGARVIDVTHLVQQLTAGCHKCGEKLSLDRVTKEARRGLASVFHIYCCNCEKVTKVHTSKFHVPEGKHSRTVVHNSCFHSIR